MAVCHTARGAIVSEASLVGYDLLLKPTNDLPCGNDAIITDQDSTDSSLHAI